MYFYSFYINQKTIRCKSELGTFCSFQVTKTALLECNTTFSVLLMRRRWSMTQRTNLHFIQRLRSPLTQFVKPPSINPSIYRNPLPDGCYKNKSCCTHATQIPVCNSPGFTNLLHAAVKTGLYQP